MVAKPGWLRAKALYKKWLVARAQRKAAKSQVQGAVEMRGLSRAALTKLARYKADKRKSPLDSMWERRVLPPPKVGDPLNNANSSTGQAAV